MNTAYKQAMSLFHDKRWEQALEVFRQITKDEPNDVRSLAHIALCQLELGDEVGADDAARHAYQVDAQAPLACYAMAQVAFRTMRLRQAENMLQRARQMDPDCAAYYGLAALIQQRRHRWPDALELASQGLAHDADDALCIQALTRSLVKMGRVVEAREVLRGAVALDAQDPMRLTHDGWNELDNHRHKAAAQAFLQALRVDPELSWAREGLAESFKSVAPAYAWALRFLLRRQQFRDDRHMLMAFGEMMVSRLIERIGDRSRRLKGIALTYLISRGILMYVTWVARPLSNLLLLLHPQGRLALSQEQRTEAGLAGIGVGTAMLSLATLVMSFLGQGGLRGGTAISSLLACIVSVIMISVLASSYDCFAGWPRQVMGVLASGLLAIGLYAIVKIFIWPPDWDGWNAFVLFVNGTVLADFASYFLRNIRPPRPLRRPRSA